MRSNKKNGLAVGILFLTAMASYMLGSELIASSAGSGNQFSEINISLLRIGIVLEFVNSAAVVGIAALLYSIISDYSKGTAMAYVASRIIEAVLLLLGSVCILLMPALDGEMLPTLATPILKIRADLFQFSMISLGLGSFFLCWLLFRQRRIPILLALIGVVGYFALFVSGWLGLFGLSEYSTILFIPGAIFEIAFPIWLFIKGFPTSSPSKT